MVGAEVGVGLLAVGLLLAVGGVFLFGEAEDVIGGGAEATGAATSPPLHPVARASSSAVVASGPALIT